MPSTVTLDEHGNPTEDDGQHAQPMQRTVDLAPVCFSGTFRNPCFWLLLGVGATLAVQYVLSRRK